MRSNGHERPRGGRYLKYRPPGLYFISVPHRSRTPHAAGHLAGIGDQISAATAGLDPHAGAQAGAARRPRRDLHRELPQQCRPPAPSLRVIVAEGAMISTRRPLTRRRGRRGRPPRGDRGRRRASGRVGCHGLACWERGRTAMGMGTAVREKPSLGGLRRGKWVVVPQLKSSLSSGPAPAWGMTAVLHWQV